MQNPVYLVFACLIGGRDLLYTIYDVPSISICRADQRTKALSRLGLPPSVYTEVTELQEGPARPHRPVRRRVRRLQPPADATATPAAPPGDAAAATVAAADENSSKPAGGKAVPEDGGAAGMAGRPEEVAGESLGECRGMEDIWADVADGCNGEPLYPFSRMHVTLCMSLCDRMHACVCLCGCRLYASVTPHACQPLFAHPLCSLWSCGSPRVSMSAGANKVPCDKQQQRRTAPTAAHPNPAQDTPSSAPLRYVPWRSPEIHRHRLSSVGCVTQRKLQTPRTAKEHKRQGTPTTALLAVSGLRD